MKVGDLVVQLGWEADGAGLVTKVYGHRGHGEPAYATVCWPGGECDHAWDQLEILNESR